VILAAHCDDSTAAPLRGTARLGNRPENYDCLLDTVDSPSTGLKLRPRSLQETPCGEIYGHLRRFARRVRIGYIHFRQLPRKVPHFVASFVDEGDIDMAGDCPPLARRKFYGRRGIKPHPCMTRAESWHACMAYALGCVHALVQNAGAVGPSWSLARVQVAQSGPEPCPLVACAFW